MLKHTALHAEHLALGAKLVDFAGWEMPIQYASQLDEHHAVRRSAGMFDVAHMTAVDVQGARAQAFLRYLLANDVAKLKTPGKALYSCMLNEAGGVIDDLIVYFLDAARFRIVVNAGTTEKDLAWMRRQAQGFEVDVCQRGDLGILAAQGPQAREKAGGLLPASLTRAALALSPFSAAWQGEWFVGRTGYTGEDGFELILPHADLVELWKKLRDAGVTPCGLGARDTLRLEAGMNLYGQDMDETVSPLECGLGWTVAWPIVGTGAWTGAGKGAERDFIGLDALRAQRAAPPVKTVGLVLESRGVMRAHQRVASGDGADPEAIGELTSGGFAPTLKRSIAFARVPTDTEGPYKVEIRGEWLSTREVKPPFARHGKALIDV